MFKAGSRSVIQFILRPQRGLNKLIGHSIYPKDKVISRALSSWITRKQGPSHSSNILHDHKYLRESRQPWSVQYRGYAEADKSKQDKDAKNKKEDDDDFIDDEETMGAKKEEEEGEPKPDEQEAAEAALFGGAKASIFVGSLYYVVTRQTVEGGSDDTQLAMVMDLMRHSRIESQTALMRLNRVELFRDMVSPTTDINNAYFQFNPKVISKERLDVLMRDIKNIPSLLASGAITRVTDPEEIAKIDAMTPSHTSEFQVQEEVVARTYPNIQAALYEWLRKDENTSMRNIIYTGKQRYRIGWYPGFLVDLIKTRLVYAPLMGLLAAIIASLVLLLWLIFAKTPKYYAGRGWTKTKESIFAWASAVLPVTLPTPDRDYYALKETIYQELVDEGYVSLPEEIDPEPLPESNATQNNS